LAEKKIVYSLWLQFISPRLFYHPQTFFSFFRFGLLFTFRPSNEWSFFETPNLHVFFSTQLVSTYPRLIYFRYARWLFSYVLPIYQPLRYQVLRSKHPYVPSFQSQTCQGYWIVFFFLPQFSFFCFRLLVFILSQFSFLFLCATSKPILVRAETSSKIRVIFGFFSARSPSFVAKDLDNFSC